MPLLLPACLWFWRLRHAASTNEGRLMPHLALIRHGESQWNRDNRFTGWADVDLTEDGVAQMRGAATKVLRLPIYPIRNRSSKLRSASSACGKGRFQQPCTLAGVL